jgi:hypothetical protein
MPELLQNHLPFTECSIKSSKALISSKPLQLQQLSAFLIVLFAFIL